MAATNRVWSALSEEERRRLEPRLERVRLPSGKVLYDPGDTIRHAFFPLDGVISLLASTATGDAVEVAMIGNEGVVGLPIFLPVNTAPYQVQVQISADAYRVRAECVLPEFRRDSSLQKAVLGHVHNCLHRWRNRAPATGITTRSSGSAAGC